MAVNVDVEMPPKLPVPVHATLPKVPVPVAQSPAVLTKPPVVREFVETLLNVPVPVTLKSALQKALVHTTWLKEPV